MANESKVKWREWSDEAFADAKAQDKPLLLGISAVWCHWCHVMDRGVPGDPVHTGVYNNQGIADFINANYIPVRVDNDQRPDINARYNMGGWPTTCFLTPEGDVIYGGTYFAPSQMRQLLPRVAEVWRDDRQDILEKLSERETATDEGRKTQDSTSSSVERLASSANAIISSVSDLIVRNFDPKNAGLGNDQKFPMSDAWALLLAVSAQTGDQKLLAMVTRTLVAMGTKGMYDLVAGGWFRYSTTPDWSVPHFEKMLEDHGRLLPVYLSAIQICRSEGRDADAETLGKVVRSSLDYLTTILLRDEDGLTYFAGSQDADEEYYLLSRDERAGLSKTPFIDWRVYADWNALMVSALTQASVVLDQPGHADLATRIWRTLVTRCVRDDGSVIHSLVERDGAMEPSALHGQLGDQAALVRASLDLAQYVPGMGDECMAVARKGMTFAMAQLTAPDGGFYDSPVNPDAKGMLRTRIQPIFDNCAMAEALLTMSYFEEGEDGRRQTLRQAQGRLDDALSSAVSRQSSVRELARQTLAAFIDEYPRYREHGSPYALAVMRATQEPDEIVIVAHTDDAAPFVRAAQATYSPWRIVRVLDPQRDAELIRERGYPMSRTPVAFVCKGTACSAPIFDPASLTKHTLAGG